MKYRKIRVKLVTKDEAIELNRCEDEYINTCDLCCFTPGTVLPSLCVGRSSEESS